MPDVELAVEDGAARLSLTRPKKRNAMTAVMWETTIAGLTELRSNPGVHALQIRGSGGSFCAGGDLNEVRLPDGSESLSYRDLVAAGLTAIRNFPVTTVALVDGACIGGGCNIALACDVRFALPSARFAIPAVRYGLVFEQSGLARLTELLGSGQATRMLLSGVTVGGREAAEIGLVEYCAEDAPEACERYLADVGNGHGPTAATTVQLVRRMAGRSTPASLERPAVIST